MEIKMAYCPNGHYYNAALHDSCPECAKGAGKTEAIGSAGGFSKTEKVGGGYSGGFSETVAVDSLRDADVEPFQPTMIGTESVEGRPEPVVGWLVCIEGVSRGVDYRLHAGYNYIGREIGDVHIHGDMQISRKNHAMIAYDSSERTYYVGPSAGRNLIKVNGKTVLNAAEIKSGDVISIGTTKLMFVALCGEAFGWDEGGHV
ncbi:MAG: FHA domain-containing protein [Oscillospiraceae bacterium]|nr:FHA domain-containing protein [Oscillospiraceae bacterium]